MPGVKRVTTSSTHPSFRASGTPYLLKAARMGSPLSDKQHAIRLHCILCLLDILAATWRKVGFDIHALGVLGTHRARVAARKGRRERGSSPRVARVWPVAADGMHGRARAPAPAAARYACRRAPIRGGVHIYRRMQCCVAARINSPLEFV